MLSSNIEALDLLLSEDLIFIDHTGSLYFKNDDINPISRVWFQLVLLIVPI